MSYVLVTLHPFKNSEIYWHDWLGGLSRKIIYVIKIKLILPYHWSHLIGIPSYLIWINIFAYFKYIFKLWYFKCNSGLIKCFPLCYVNVNFLLSLKRNQANYLSSFMSHCSQHGTHQKHPSVPEALHGEPLPLKSTSLSVSSWPSGIRLDHFLHRAFPTCFYPPTTIPTMPLVWLY